MSGVIDPREGTGQVELLFGRAVERAAIDALLADAEGGSSGALALAGPAGIGRSSLPIGGDAHGQRGRMSGAKNSVRSS